MSWVRLLRVAIAAVLTLVVSSYSMGDVLPDSVPVDRLFGAAVMVVRGEVKQVISAEKRVAEWHGVVTVLTTYVVQVVTDKIYKGNAAAAVRIAYVRPDDPLCAVSTCIHLNVGDFDYFFLDVGKQGFELNDPHFGQFRASRLTESRGQTGLDALKSDFVAGLNDPDEAVRLTQVELIGDSGRKTDAEQLLRLLPSADALSRATVFYSLLQLGDYSALTSMRDFLEVRSNVPAIERLRFLSLSQINAISDSEAEDALIGLAQSPADDVRESAIHALRTIQSAKAIPVFIRALDDRVQLVRYDAVLGLAEIEHNWTLAPAVDAFKADERKYIGAWKSWWQTSGQPPHE
jgi:HEAT repeat protein